MGTGPPWHRRDDEEDAAYMAFEKYRDQPLPRTFSAVTDSRSMKVPEGTLCFWSARYAWKARVLAYDRWISAVVDAERAAALAMKAKDFAPANVKIATTLQATAILEAQKLLEQARRSPGMLKVRDALKLADLAIKVSRLICGETTEHVEVTQVDLSGASDEELEVVRAMVQKMEAQ